MRIALLSTLEAVPWLPMVHGLLSGLTELGHDTRPFRVADHWWLHCQLFEEFCPDLVLLPFCRWEWDRVRGTLYQEALRATEAPIAGVFFDDPYDMRTSLELVPELDFVFTPEPLALPIYESLDMPCALLPPFVSGLMHPPRPPGKRPYVYDVFWFGGTDWRPRRTIIPPARDWCRHNGKVYGEVAGNKRWTAGTELAQNLHAARLTFEIPRFDRPTVSNPHQIPCTYTGPRLHIAAATATFALRINPKPDGVYGGAYPVVEAAELLEALGFWTDRSRDLERAERAELARLEWVELHRPDRRCRSMLEALSAAGVVRES